ncbi:hypothetical protein M8C13_02285 [Crossiella sp. SN42]|uniref:hypothetical protein n=1 Tax=Crossiella sp. SN42 TaxID=2944808 RepID=UPI00207D2249|nr:hypothetical protein [Crossiella sp. SN42]MCO1574585.1 hypothetical protein [Crossiella sp. SN42]
MSATVASLVVLCLGAAACGGRPMPELTWTASTTPSAAAAQDKYVEVFPGCQEIAGKVPGLPPLLKGSDVPAGADRDVRCEFAPPPTGPFVTVQLFSWHSDPNDPRYRADVGRGRHLARERFATNTDPADDGVIPDLGFGEQAKWQRPGNGDGCYLTVLDANAVFLLQYSILGGTRLDPKSEQCRGPLRALAKPVYDAVQPR